MKYSSLRCTISWDLSEIQLILIKHIFILKTLTTIFCGAYLLCFCKYFFCFQNIARNKLSGKVIQFSILRVKLLIERPFKQYVRNLGYVGVLKLFFWIMFNKSKILSLFVGEKVKKCVN